MRGVTPWALGPRNRPYGQPEVCICGGSYTTYWAHRQTGRHKRHEGRFRKRQRVQSLNQRMREGRVKFGGRAWQRAAAYLGSEVVWGRDK